MSNVTIHLGREAQQSLTEKANRGGQTLEIYLQQIVEEHIRSGVASDDPNLETNEDELVERPWRGVFVPGRPRSALFSQDVSPAPEELPKRPPNVNMNWHRQVSNDESVSSIFTTSSRFRVRWWGRCCKRADGPSATVAPYREHLSQAFGRFFMRVGLPQPITTSW